MNSANTYGYIAILFHWLVAVILVGMLGLGFYMTGLGDSEISLKFSLYQWHKSFGILVLLLTFARLGWRTFNPAPPPLDVGWRKKAAKVSHTMLYALTLLVPLAGWMMVSASPWNIPTVLFDVVSWPHVPGLAGLEDKASAEAAFKLVHKTLAYSTALLVLLHASAAVHHHLMLKDKTLVRMIPILREPTTNGQ